jgi:4'-phosphopantetheinyl transferase
MMVPAGAATVIGSGDVHVWRFARDLGKEALGVLGGYLCASERARAGACHIAREGDRFVAARGQLRWILSRYLGVVPRRIGFAHGRQNKPYLAGVPNPGDLRFNLSHSAELAMVAVAAGWEVGADIERVRPNVPCAALAHRFFSSRERQALAALREERQVAGFFRCWTSKEAYLKGLGFGLSVPLSSCEVAVDPDRPAALLQPYRGLTEDSGAWCLYDIGSAESHAATLAIRGQPARILVHTLSWPRFGGPIISVLEHPCSGESS